MFSAVKRLFGGGTSACSACGTCNPEVLAKCQPPEPGSVTPHIHHVLVRLPPPQGAAEEVQKSGAWWPESVDKEPAVESINAALKQRQGEVGGKVKVTAFDDVAPAAGAVLGDGAPSGTFDVLIFPAGLKLSGLALDGLGESVAAAIVQGDAGEALGGLTLLVCSHGRRDLRCGVLGSQLAACLTELLAGRGLEGEARVLKTSHVGGHVYAGNVLVYGPTSPCNGDWFGGVNADNAEEFLDALLKAKVAGSADPQLRKLWRGRVGLSKEEQKALYEQQAGGVKDIEDLQGAA